MNGIKSKCLRINCGWHGVWLLTYTFIAFHAEENHGSTIRWSDDDVMDYALEHLTFEGIRQNMMQSEEPNEDELDPRDTDKPMADYWRRESVSWTRSVLPPEIVRYTKP